MVSEIDPLSKRFYGINVNSFMEYGLRGNDEIKGRFGDDFQFLLRGCNLSILQ